MCVFLMARSSGSQSFGFGEWRGTPWELFYSRRDETPLFLILSRLASVISNHLTNCLFRRERPVRAKLPPGPLHCGPMAPHGWNGRGTLGHWRGDTWWSRDGHVAGGRPGGVS